MNRSSRLVIYLLLSSLCLSCSAVKSYPRCYIFRAPTPVDVLQSDTDLIKLMTTLSIDNFSLAKDVITVKSTHYKLDMLEAAWPENGCINLRRPPPEQGDTNDKWVIAHCQEYLEKLITHKKISADILRTDVAAKYPQFTCH